MLRSRVLIAAFVLAGSFAMTTGTSQASTVRIRTPWSEQTVYALAPDRSYVAEWNGPGAGWTEIGGPASAIYAGSAGVFATDPSTGDISEYNGTPRSWTQIGGPGAQFAEGGGHLYGIGPGNAYVAEWNGAAGGWTIIGGPASQIAAGPAGLVEINTDLTETLIYDGVPGDWTPIGDAAQGVYSGNAIYAAEPTGLEQWTGGTTWETILDDDSSYYSVLFAGSAGLFIQNFDTDYKYDGTPDDWTQIGALPVFVGAANQSYVYGFAIGAGNTASADVEVYSGSGSTWTVIGGPAWQPWLGGNGLAAGD